MRAYIYARFSTLDQARGSSLARQLSDCRAYCDRKGWERSPEREIIDEGRSAFHGANRAAGSGLAEFEEMVRRGTVGDDAVLVVERLDRLSRQSPAEVFHLMTRLTDAGVTVATVDSERPFTKGTFDFANLIELVVKAQVSYEESAKKSHRLSAAWAQKRERAERGERRAMTRQCPAWLAVDDETGEYVIREDRAAIVRRVFDLTVAGFGKHLIASTFNREGIATWGPQTDQGRGWYPSYIQRIIGSRSVIGEFQPHRKIAGRRQPEGGVLTSLYPPVIDEVVFLRAQAQREARTRMPGRRGRTLSNLFSGIAHCGGCSGKMTFRNKGKPGEQYLVCDSALRSNGCEHRVHFNYPVIETLVVEYFLPLALFDRHFSPEDNVHAAELDWIKQRKIVADLIVREERLVDVLSSHASVVADRQLTDVLSALREAKHTLKQRERDLDIARGRVSSPVQYARVRELLEAFKDDDDAVRGPARAIVQTALREIVERIVCDPVNLHTTAYVGMHMICFDRTGLMIETTEDPEGRLSLFLERNGRD